MSSGALLPIKSVYIFADEYNKKALEWKEKIKDWISEKYQDVLFTETNPDIVFVLGGDGTILNAVTKYIGQDVLIAGLNLGHVGFLASCRKEENFLESLEKIFNGKYQVVEKMNMEASVFRKEEVVYATKVLNDLSIESILGVVSLDVYVEGFHLQKIRGSGLLVSTSTGSTARNMSSHGPIVMPNIKCMILTEMMDHNTPTPSVVVKYDNKIEIDISDFRNKDWVKMSETGQAANVVLVPDGRLPFVLNKGDKIKVTRAERLTKFVELEPNYFFKSLQEQFSFS